MTRILALSGSSRKASFNTQLVKAAAHAAQAAGGDVTFVDLGDYDIPLYNGDLEESQGLPVDVQTLKSLFAAHDGLLLACPEYNSSITPLLKNTIDWVSRPAPGEAPLAAFKGKVAALLAASPGGFGGMRGLVHVRSILGNMGVIVLPDQLAVPRAHEAFDATGTLTDERLAGRANSLATTLVETTTRLTG